MDAAALLLQEARARAAQRVAELSGTFAEIVDASTSANLDDEHDPEGATVAFERAQVSVLLDRAQARLREIDAALLRVGQGAYGLCERCGTPIPDARLFAEPATRWCVACASR